MTKPGDYVEFKEDGYIETGATITEPSVATAIGKGTYTQDGSKFTYSIKGVDYNRVFMEYPDDMKAAYTNLEGTIDGNDITMTFSILYQGNVVYYHEIYTLAE